MRHHRPAPSVACALCGNEEDLHEVNGHPVCTPCRTCPHGEKWWHSTCRECLRELHTVFHLTGPAIASMERYAAMARALEVDPADLLVWTAREEDQLMAWEQSVGTDADNGRWTPSSPPARTAPFPYPLLHHLRR